MSGIELKVSDLDALFFDFDGVLTDNRVYLDQNGLESVCCTRADGLAFDALRKLKIPTYILSTERNSVVLARGKKLGVPVVQGVENKVVALRNIASEEKYRIERVLYIGNDLNDYRVMQICGYSVCPADSHPKIKSVATVILNATGGSGVVRELLEAVFELNLIEILYS